MRERSSDVTPPSVPTSPAQPTAASPASTSSPKPALVIAAKASLDASMLPDSRGSKCDALRSAPPAAALPLSFRHFCIPSGASSLQHAKRVPSSCDRAARLPHSPHRVEHQAPGPSLTPNLSHAAPPPLTCAAALTFAATTASTAPASHLRPRHVVALPHSTYRYTLARPPAYCASSLAAVLKVRTLVLSDPNEAPSALTRPPLLNRGGFRHRPRHPQAPRPRPTVAPRPRLLARHLR